MLKILTTFTRKVLQPNRSKQNNTELENIVLLWKGRQSSLEVHNRK